MNDISFIPRTCYIIKLLEQASRKLSGQGIAFFCSELQLKSTRQIKSKSLRNGSENSPALGTHQLSEGVRLFRFFLVMKKYMWGAAGETLSLTPNSLPLMLIAYDSRKDIKLEKKVHLIKMIQLDF